MAELTDEQAAIYDRQIRVWGADVQARLTGAKVLVLGCTPLAAEVLKNIVLAGVGHVTLVDDSPVSSAPMTFLAGKYVDPGKSVAAVFSDSLQEMNPMVSVKTAPGQSSSVPDADFLKSFHLTICFGLHAGQQHALNQACRAQRVRFMAAVSRGCGAYMFADLLQHTFKHSSDGDRDTLPAATIDYVPLVTAVGTPWIQVYRDCSPATAKTRNKHANKFLAPFSEVAALEIKLGRQAVANDFETLNDSGRRHLTEYGCADKLWDAERLKDFLESDVEFAPVNAVIGGLIGNDVVRCISQVGLPTMNVLFFNMMDNKAQVHTMMGPS